MYPKDTVTKKQMDRKVDRLETRVDHHLDRLRKLTLEFRVMQSQMTRFEVFLRSLVLEREEE